MLLNYRVDFIPMIEQANLKTVSPNNNSMFTENIYFLHDLLIYNVQSRLWWEYFLFLESYCRCDKHSVQIKISSPSFLLLIR